MCGPREERLTGRVCRRSCSRSRGLVSGESGRIEHGSSPLRALGTVRLRFLTALGLATSAGCDSAPPPTSLPAAVVATRTDLNLGAVRARRWARGRVRLRNASASPVVLSPADAWPPCRENGFGWCVVERGGHWDLQSPIEIPPGDFVRVQMGFRSDGTDWTDETLRVATCPDATCTTAVGLRVEAGGGSLVCTPSILDFGLLPAGSTVTRNLTCTALSRPAELTASPITTPFRRAPDQQTLIQSPTGVFEMLVELPEGSSRFSDELEIRSPFFETARIVLEAEAAPIRACSVGVIAPQALQAVRGTPAPPWTLSLTNAGNETCAVGSVRVLPEAEAPPSIRLSLGDEHDLRLRPGEQLDLPLEVDTSELSAPQRTVRIEAGGNQAPVDVVLRARIIDDVPGRSFSPVLVDDRLDFESVSVMCARRLRSVRLLNAGQTPFTVTRVELSGAPGFSLTPSSDNVLLPGRSRDFSVGFQPEALGPREGVLHLELEGVLETASFEILLTGTGVAFEEQEDVFPLLPPPALDTLIVVDPSLPSNEARRFARIAERLEGRDLQFGVSTTATGAGTSNGQLLPLVGSDRVLRSSALGSQLPAVLGARLAEAASAPASTEAGLEAMYRALSTPTIFQENRGLLRNNSLLATLFLTSREDRSAESVDFFLNFFRSIRFSTRDIQRVLVAGGPTGGCRGRVDALDTERYRNLALRFPGPINFVSICSDDAPEQLADALEAWSAPRSRFFLTHLAIQPAALQVRLDDAPLPRLGPSGQVNWTFSETLNAIDVQERFASSVGSELRVTYPAQCLD